MILEPDLLPRLARLSFTTRRPVRGGMRGEHTSERQAQSLEFAEYRPYYPGDEFRYVDWHVYLRSKKLYRKAWVAEENLVLNVLVDTSASMASGRPAKLDYALGLAEALVLVALASGEKATVMAIGRDLVPLTPQLMGLQHLGEADRLLARVTPAGEARPLAALNAFGLVARHALTIVVSDLLTPDDWFSGLGVLRLAGEVRLVHLLAAEEEDPVLAGRYRLADAETGGELDFHADSITMGLYRREVDAFRAEARAACEGKGVSYWPVTTGHALADYILETLVAGGFFQCA